MIFRVRFYASHLFQAVLLVFHYRKCNKRILPRKLKISRITIYIVCAISSFEPFIQGEAHKEAHK